MKYMVCVAVYNHGVRKS